MAFVQPASAGVCSTLLSLFGRPRQPAVVADSNIQNISWKKTAFGWLGEGYTEWGKTQIVTNENYTAVSVVPFGGTLRFHEGLLNELREQVPSLKYKIVEPLPEEAASGQYALTVEKRNSPDTFEGESKALLEVLFKAMPAAIRARM